MARTASRRRSADTDERDDYLDDYDDGSSRRGRRRDDPEDEDTGADRRRTRRSRFSESEGVDRDEDDRPDSERGGLDQFARRARRGREEDTEDERPARGRGNRSSRSERSEPSPRGRGGRGGRSERSDRGSDRGERSERGGRGRTSSTARKGWGGYRQTADSVQSDFANNLKIVDNTDMLVKVLDEEPVAAYAEHWLTIDEKRRSYICLGEGCPICDRLGDRPTVRVAMNVADMDVNPPDVKIWQFGTQVGDLMEKFAENPKTSPINRDDIYWTITRTKKNDRYSTTVRPVKARDLEEDFDMEPLNEEELDELEAKRFEQDQVYTVKSKADLNEMIRENNLDDEY